MVKILVMQAVKLVIVSTGSICVIPIWWGGRVCESLLDHPIIKATWELGLKVPERAPNE